MKFDKVLVDADILVYQVGFATQHNVYHVYFEGLYEPFIYTDKRKLNKLLDGLEYYMEVYIQTEPLLSAKLTVDRIINDYCTKFETKDTELYLTGEGNFREGVATTLPYKGNRTSDKPVHYKAIRDYLIKKHKAEVIQGQEADDELSISQYSYHKEGILSVIVTIDKDLDMVEGWHYNPKKDSLYHIDHLTGMKWFFTQMLTGDSVDNIQGIKGIGKVKAGKLLKDVTSYEDMEAIVLTEYEKAYDNPSDVMTEMGRLLWMRTKPNEVWRIT